MFVAIGLVHAPASAKPTGYNVVCNNCHDGGMVPTVTLTANPTTLQPGGMTTLTISVTRTNGNVAGFFITTMGRGTFALVDTAGTRLIPADADGPGGVTHSRTKTTTTGNSTFQVRWTAPATAGSVDFDVYAVSATGKIDPALMKVFPEDDGMGHARLGMSFGCNGMPYWPDEDGDGFGTKTDLGPTQQCQPMKNLSLTNDDCNDQNPLVNPKGVEICNKIDDNCNGKVDEDLPPVPLYPDVDRDGYGTSNGVPMMGACGAVDGYSPKTGDCNDNDAKVYPGAKETCNGVDDDCNGTVDNGVRPICGTGWCARASATCDIAQCSPGMPRPEMCNGIDDDCNGMIDEGPGLCPGGQTCQDAVCKPGSGGGTGGSPGMTGPDGGAPSPMSVGAGGCDLGGALGSRGLAVGLLAVAVAAAGLMRRRRRG